jgi:hypothetical protein
MRLVGAALAAGLALGAGAAPAPSPAPSFRVSARNELDLGRPAQMVELSLPALPGLAADDLPRLRVTDTSTGRETLSQAVDSDGDGDFDQLVFQADFAPREARVFLLARGEPRLPRKEDFRVYGRFVRERFDDFAWENDRVAHRMYGAALETWRKEPLTSSAVDVWVKRTPRLILNDWYMTDDYHRDHGEGADLYSAGPSRGCGGSGIWEGGRLYVSRNFRDSRVLANGPLRLVFELSYLPWDAGAGRQVSEKKRVTLDAGSNMNRFESAYTVQGGSGPLSWAAGIKKAADADVRVERAQASLRTWEPLKGGGSLGCGIVLAPGLLADVVEAEGNMLMVARAADGRAASYYAGSAWDRNPEFAGRADWDRYLDQWARRVASPLRIEVAGP